MGGGVGGGVGVGVGRDVPPSRRGRSTPRSRDGTFHRSGRGSGAHTGGRASPEDTVPRSWRAKEHGQRNTSGWGGSTFFCSQSSGVSGGAHALPRLVVAGGAVQALALQEAVLAEEAGVAGLLAAPALEAVGADAGAGDGVAFGPVAALTLVAAVGPPEVVLAA